MLLVVALLLSLLAPATLAQGAPQEQTPKFYSGTQDPGRCHEGDMYYRTDTHILSVCGASNDMRVASISRGTGVPTTDPPCSVPGDRGRVYIRTDAAAAHSSLYACVNTTGSTTAWELQAGGGGGGGGATIDSVTNLIAGDGLGNGVDSGIAPSSVATLTGTQALTNKTVDGVTPTTFGFLDPTSSVQTQLNGKQASLGFTPFNVANNLSEGVAATMRTNLGLGTAAVVSSTCAGDLTGTLPNCNVLAAAITLAKMANLAANSFIGNNTGSPAAPLALTVAQVKTLLALACGDLSNAAVSCSTDATNATNMGSGTLAAARLPNAGVHTGDAAGTFPALTVTSLNGGGTATGHASLDLAVSTLAALSTGLLKVTTTTGAVSTAAAGTDFVGGQANLTTPGCIPFQNGTTGLLTCDSGFLLDTANQQMVVPNGTTARPAIIFGASAANSHGFFWASGTSVLVHAILATDAFGVSTSGIQVPNANAIKWTVNADAASGSAVTGLCSNAPGVVEFNNGSCGNIRDFKNRHSLSGGTAPSIGSGFAASGSTIAGGDESGRVTIGSTTPGNTGVVTFGTAYGTAPSCVANNETTAMLVQCLATTTNITLNGISLATGIATNFAAADKLTWRVGGY